MDVSEDVLGLVLERVDSHVSLIRAAAVCKRWRRAIADAAFLRRFRALHAPPITGYYRRSVFVPSSPSMVDAHHFSLDFLPNGAESWIVVDSRGSLLLVKDRAGWDAGNPLTDQIVCEPLTRRYMRIHPPADFNNGSYCREPYLIDGEANEAGGGISMSNFRVLCLIYRDSVTHAAMYTVGSSWSKKNIGHIGPKFEHLLLMGSGKGEIYWRCAPGKALITVDRSTGDFSSSELPPLENLGSCRWDSNLGRDGKLRVFTVSNDAIKVFVRCEGGEWALEKRIMLPEATCGLPGYEPSFFSGHQFILRSVAGFVVLSPWIGRPWPFSINLETTEVAPGAEISALMEYACELPWPPALHACLDG